MLLFFPMLFCMIENLSQIRLFKGEEVVAFIPMKIKKKWILIPMKL
jgi:hypothetical protein